MNHRQHHHELVAAEAGDRILGAHAGADAAGHMLQQLVAGGVSPRVVDWLEAVEIDEQHGRGQVEPLAARQRLSQTVVEQGAVGQAGEGVEVGPPPHLVLPALALGHVGNQRHRADKPAVAVVQGAGNDALGKRRAVLAAVFDLAFPRALAAHRFRQRGRQRLIRAGGQQDARVDAQHVGLAVPGDDAERPVDLNDPAVPIGHRNAFGGGVEHPLADEQPFFEPDDIGNVGDGDDRAARAAAVVGRQAAAGNRRPDAPSVLALGIIEFVLQVFAQGPAARPGLVGNADALMGEDRFAALLQAVVVGGQNGQRRPVPPRDVAVAVQHDHAGRHHVEQAAVEFFAGLQAGFEGRALGNVVDEGIEQPAAVDLDRARIDLHRAHFARGEAVAEHEHLLPAAQRVIHGLQRGGERLDVDAVDAHARQHIGRITIEPARRPVGEHDAAGGGIGDVLDRQIVLENVEIERLLLLQGPVLPHAVHRKAARRQRQPQHEADADAVAEAVERDLRLERRQHVGGRQPDEGDDGQAVDAVPRKKALDRLMGRHGNEGAGGRGIEGQVGPVRIDRLAEQGRHAAVAGNVGAVGNVGGADGVARAKADACHLPREIERRDRHFQHAGEVPVRFEAAHERQLPAPADGAELRPGNEHVIAAGLLQGLKKRAAGQIAACRAGGRGRDQPAIGGKHADLRLGAGGHQGKHLAGFVGEAGGVRVP